MIRWFDDRILDGMVPVVIGVGDEMTRRRRGFRSTWTDVSLGRRGPHGSGSEEARREALHPRSDTVGRSRMTTQDRWMEWSCCDGRSLVRRYSLSLAGEPDGPHRLHVPPAPGDHVVPHCPTTLSVGADHEWKDLRIVLLLDEPFP